MWKVLRKRIQPSARDLLLRIIPKVKLEPIVLPEKYEIKKNWKPPESKMLTMAAKREAAVKSMTDKYAAELSALDEAEASNIINNA